MSRNRKVINDQNRGIRKEMIQPISSIPESDRDIYIKSRPQVSLDKIAFEYYNDPSLWWVIARANNLKSAIVKDGITIRIPINPTVTFVKE